MAKDEPMLSAASYFWSNTINAFLFNQGPMTPTLLDITMITGLDVTSSANPVSLNTENQFAFKTRSIGGWTGFITINMGIGPVTPKEHVAFLMMWLEKFLFCGQSCGSTTNWQHIAEALVNKRQFPLGKYLLGYLYHTLSSASARLATNSVIGTGGPWWLLQIWLNLHTIRVAKRPALFEADFLSVESTIDDEGNEIITRRCISFGEAASTYPGSELSADLFMNWFGNFYDGFPKDSRSWFVYEYFADFELPADFRFDEINSDKFEKSREVFIADISPCILPIGIHQGRNIQISYKFYYPMSAARQVGMSQLPITLYFSDKIQTRGEIISALMMDQLLSIQGPLLVASKILNWLR